MFANKRNIQIIQDIRTDCLNKPVLDQVLIVERPVLNNAGADIQ